jgi:hypothetical protein
VDLGTLYLLVAAALIFGACAFAAKKIFPRLNYKQMLVIALITLLVLVLIWILLDLWSKKRDDAPPPELRPDYSTDASAPTKSGLATGVSTGAGAIETMA